jgi:hypothetical protein
MTPPPELSPSAVGAPAPENPPPPTRTSPRNITRRLPRCPVAKRIASVISRSSSTRICALVGGAAMLAMRSLLRAARSLLRSAISFLAAIGAACAKLRKSPSRDGPPSPRTGTTNNCDLSQSPNPHAPLRLRAGMVDFSARELPCQGRLALSTSRRRLALTGVVVPSFSSLDSSR